MRTFLGLALVVVLCAVAIGDWLTGGPDPDPRFLPPLVIVPAEDPDAELNKPVDDALDKPLEAFSREKGPFGKAVADFSAATGLNFDVRWTALQAAGIDEHTPVTLSLKQVQARKVLQVILSDAGGGAASVDFTVDKGVVVVSTKDDLENTSFQHVRVFPLGPLLADFEPGTRKEGGVLI